jgi:hypothetical protein
VVYPHYCFTASAVAANAATDENATPIGQTRRLRLDVVPAVGCVSLEGLKRIAKTMVDQNGDASLDQLNAEDCRVFSTFHGEVLDAKDAAVCILGLGGYRCWWFVFEATEPARRY